MKARIAELERRLGLNSSNSGKPPASEEAGADPEFARTLRQAAGRPEGA
jgi:transposase